MIGKKSIMVCILFCTLFLVVYAATKVYYIDGKVCSDCGQCIENCTEEAISRSEIDGKFTYYIDPENYVSCDLCVENCPEEAISLVDSGKGKKKGR